MVRIDFDGVATSDVEYEEIAGVIRSRILQRLEGDGMLAGFGHIGEIDVVRRAVWIKP
jgi:hypothetical protein